jgi:hypothetical protein
VQIRVEGEALAGAGPLAEDRLGERARTGLVEELARRVAAALFAG